MTPTSIGEKIAPTAKLPTSRPAWVPMVNGLFKVKMASDFGRCSVGSVFIHSIHGRV